MSSANVDHSHIERSDVWANHVRSASEQLFFLDMPVAHIVAYEDQLRERRVLKAFTPTRVDRRARLLLDAGIEEVPREIARSDSIPGPAPKDWKSPE